MKKIIINIICLLLILIIIKNIRDNKIKELASFKLEKFNKDLKTEMVLKGNYLTIKESLYNTQQNIKDKKNCNTDPLFNYAKVNSFYIPQEGGFIYKEYKNGAKSVYTDIFGLTFRPYCGTGFVTDKKIHPFAGSRLAYYKSWGCGIMFCGNELMFSAEKRLDNLPFFNNSALLIGINKNTAVFGAAVFL